MTRTLPGRAGAVVGLFALVLLAGCSSSEQSDAPAPVALASAPASSTPPTTTSATPTSAPPTSAAAVTTEPAAVVVRAPVTPRVTTPPVAPPATRPAPAPAPARTTTTARAAAAAPAGDCDPNYSGCVPIASDVDCAGGKGNGPAYVKGPVRVTGSDIYGLDADNDGLGCE